MQVFCRNGWEDSSPGCLHCLGERENISLEKGDYNVHVPVLHFLHYLKCGMGMSIVIHMYSSVRWEV